MFHLSLAAARINAGMSQKEAAAALNVSNNTIINWENGHTKITSDNLIKISELYKCPIEFLINNSGIVGEINRIIVTTDNDELIADITTDNVICKEGYKVRCLDSA